MTMTRIFTAAARTVPYPYSYTYASSSVEYVYEYAFWRRIRHVRAAG